MKLKNKKEFKNNFLNKLFNLLKNINKLFRKFIKINNIKLNKEMI